MTLPAGTRLGSYELIASLGQGGMGEVYRAKDTRLSRDVAVKVLPAELAGDADRLSRFEQEARSASALNHPNIITIHDVGTAEGVSYIAMELVEGRTLRELLTAGPMPARRLLPIAAQIADGLAKAHESGIVHRDLKPENVMVNKDGFVKILDFGLAKLSAPSLDASSQLATLAGPGTRPGMVMGTVGYMSPEQASGEAVDFRSDQFVLGSILYEMATGQRAFQKKTAIETLSAIIREDPAPIAAANPQAPAPLRWIVERCLAKEPENRYAATRDLARDLKQTLERLSEASMETPAAVRPKKGTRLGWPAAIAALLLVGVADLVMRQRSASRPARPAVLRQVTFAPGLEGEPAFSPDGKFLAYTTDESGNLDVLVQPLAGGEPIRIAATDADEAQPAWSPDGTRIAFVTAREHGGRLSSTLLASTLEFYSSTSHGDIDVVPALGGTPAKLVEDGHYPSWSPDARSIVFVSNREGGVHLWIVASEGGAPKRLTVADDGIDYQPAWSPDGRWIAYGSGHPTRGSKEARFNLKIIPAAGGDPVAITDDFLYITRPAWTADGKSIVFAGERNGILNLWRAPIRSGRGAGPISRITIGGGQDSDAAVSRDGLFLAFSVRKKEQSVWEVPLSGGEPRAVIIGGGADFPRLSPDGKTLLLQSDQSGKFAVWTADLQGRFLSRLTPGQELEPQACWSPDGRTMSWVKGGILQIQTVGALSAFDTGVASGAHEWSSDGKRILLGSPGGQKEIRLYDVATRTAKVLTNAPGEADYPSWSPDGRRVVFQVQRGNTREIWIVSSEGGEPRALTKDLEDSHPSWSPTDPDTVLFLRDHQRLALLSVSTGQVRFIPATPPGSFLLDYPSWSADGKKIYLSVARKSGDIFTLEGF
jgi:eukaryotic-like serine/threonine-protein kinase